MSVEVHTQRALSTHEKHIGKPARSSAVNFKFVSTSSLKRKKNL